MDIRKRVDWNEKPCAWLCGGEGLGMLKESLGDRAANYSDSFLTNCLFSAEKEILVYVHRPELPSGLLSALIKIAITNINRMGSEGLSSQGYSGTSESYLNDWPADIRRELDAYRRIKILG